MMTNKQIRTAGGCLIAANVLMLLTMVLHPAGGSIEHLRKIADVITATHSIGILSMPLSLVGYWALQNVLGKDTIVSFTAFVFVVAGSICGVIAGILNGIALPLFVKAYGAAQFADVNTIKMIIRYNTTLNHAFTIVYIMGLCTAIFLWSVIIVRTKLLTVWPGYFGITLSVVVLIMMTGGFSFLDLNGFRLFVFGSIIWSVVIGRDLSKHRPT